MFQIQNHKPMKIRTCILSSLVALATFQNVRADIAVSNLGETSTNGDGWAITTVDWVAMSFTVGTNAPTWILESADMNIWQSGFPANGFTATLRADDGGLPGTFITSFSGPEPTNTLGGEVVNYVPTAATTLIAGAKYWLVASSGMGGFAWIYTDPYSSTDTGVNGWSIDDGMAVSHDQGVTWLYSLDEPALFAINVTAVPEPATLALTGIGAFGLWLLRRRQ